MWRASFRRLEWRSYGAVCDRRRQSWPPDEGRLGQQHGADFGRLIPGGEVGQVLSFRAMEGDEGGARHCGELVPEPSSGLGHLGVVDRVKRVLQPAGSQMDASNDSVDKGCNTVQGPLFPKCGSP